MKKKLSVLAVLVLAVAISAYSVAGTYARYTTTGEVTDNARVAKWGFEIGKVNKTQADLFSDAYANLVNGNGAAEFGTATNTVEASTEANGTTRDHVIAPGTTGSYAFKVVGKPEVAYTIAIDADVKIENDIKWDATEGKYVAAGTDAGVLSSSLKFTLTDKAGTKLVDAGTAAQLKEALAGLYDGSPKKANDETDDTYTISWEWTYSVDDNTDAIDTALGNAAATNSKPSVRLTAKITATQVD